MSTLKELLNDIPVEWKAMGEVLKIKNGKDYKQFKSGEIPVYGSGGIMTHIDTHVFDKASVLIPRKGSLKNLFFVTEPFWTVDTIFWTDINRKIIEPKFIFYYLKTQNLEELNMAGGVPSLTQSVLNKLPLPIPFPNDPQKSLAIQQEIVRVLDNLSEQNKALTTALANEIDNRNKQYTYYREELFRFEGKEVEWKTLGEVASIGTGSHDTKDAVEDGFYTFYARGVNPLKLNSYDFDETAIITAGDGVGVGKVFHWVEGKYALHQRAYKIVPIYDINARYVYYYIVTNFLGYVEKQSVHSSVTSLRKPMFIKFPIAIPSTQEQERIVRLLDQFDEGTKSIVAQLEKEIELRNKQYEYYRNQLLGFNG